MSTPRGVALASKATLDLSNIRRWYRQPGSGGGAKRRLARLEAGLRALAHSPCSHRLWDEYRRIAMIESHRIVYRVSPDTRDNATAGDVLVVRILGPGRSFD